MTDGTKVVARSGGWRRVVTWAAAVAAAGMPREGGLVAGMLREGGGLWWLG
ncbi:MAG TPA: hypothetical protein VGM14_25545 [Streptosporangiaceae bacterium]